MNDQPVPTIIDPTSIDAKGKPMRKLLTFLIALASIVFAVGSPASADGMAIPGVPTIGGNAKAVMTGTSEEIFRGQRSLDTVRGQITSGAGIGRALRIWP